MARVVLGNLLYPSQTDGDGGYESESLTDIYMGRFGEEKRSAKVKFPSSSSLEKEKKQTLPCVPVISHNHLSRLCYILDRSQKKDQCAPHCTVCKKSCWEPTHWLIINTKGFLLTSYLWLSQTQSVSKGQHPGTGHCVGMLNKLATTWWPTNGKKKKKRGVPSSVE